VLSNLTPLAVTLQKAVAGSMHAAALTLGEKSQEDTWAQLLHGVKTGEIPFLKAHGVRNSGTSRRTPKTSRSNLSNGCNVQGDGTCVKSGQAKWRHEIQMKPTGQDRRRSSAALAGDERRIWATRTSAATTRLGFGFLRAGSHAPISGVNAGRKSLFVRDLLKESAEFFTFGSGQRGA